MVSYLKGQSDEIHGAYVFKLIRFKINLSVSLNIAICLALPLSPILLMVGNGIQQNTASVTSPARRHI